MLWIVPISLLVGVVALGVGCVLNARALARDFKQRRDELRARLERDALALVEPLLTAGPGDEASSGR